MNRKKLVFYTLCLLFSFIFSGCAQVTELTSEDEDRIAAYSAKTVAKFNSMKPQGILNISKKGEEDEDEQAQQEQTSPSEEIDSTVTEIEFDDEATYLDSDADAPSENISSASLTEAIGVAGLDFSFVNAKEVGYYSMGGYYDISPASGNDFLVLTFTVSNLTEADVVLDIPTTMAKFRASVGGASNTADNTILLNDLSNYSGTISPGQSEEMVLLFQFLPESLTDLSSIRLQMIQGDTTTNISL